MYRIPDSEETKTTLPKERKPLVGHIISFSAQFMTHSEWIMLRLWTLVVKEPNVNGLETWDVQAFQTRYCFFFFFLLRKFFLYAIKITQVYTHTQPHLFQWTKITYLYYQSSLYLSQHTYTQYYNDTEWQTSGFPFYHNDCDDNDDTSNALLPDTFCRRYCMKETLYCVQVTQQGRS